MNLFGKKCNPGSIWWEYIFSIKKPQTSIMSEDSWKWKRQQVYTSPQKKNVWASNTLSPVYWWISISLSIICITLWLKLFWYTENENKKQNSVRKMMGYNVVKLWQFCCIKFFYLFFPVDHFLVFISFFESTYMYTFILIITFNVHVAHVHFNYML